MAADAPGPERTGRPFDLIEGLGVCVLVLAGDQPGLVGLGFDGSSKEAGNGARRARLRRAAQMRSSSAPSKIGRMAKASMSASSSASDGTGPGEDAASRMGRSRRASLDELRNSPGRSRT